MMRTLLYSLAAFSLGIGSGYLVLGKAAPPANGTVVSASQPVVAAASNGIKHPTGYHLALPVKPRRAGGNASLQALSTVTPIPTWNYTVTASADLGGGTFSGSIVGRSPFNRGKTTTTIPTQIIPLVITIDNGSGDVQVYDPTDTTDVCVTPAGLSSVDIITGSPIFTKNNWTMNGVSQGNTQYIDAVQRAGFDSLVGGTSYHLILQPSVLSFQPMTFGSAVGNLGPGSNFSTAATGGCSSVGVIQINDIDNAVFALIQGPLAPMVNAGTFPIFLTKNVFFANAGTDLFSNCCALGYHSGFTDLGGNLQIYSPFSLDTSGVFGGDVSTLSHEMGEAINDPGTGNPTPVWGNQGQVSGSQNNFEDGDPLCPGGIAPTSKEFVVTGANGFTYHLQELAFFSWFYGPPSLGAGGKFSNNGTFGGDAILFSNGGGTH